MKKIIIIISLMILSNKTIEKTIPKCIIKKEIIQNSKNIKLLEIKHLMKIDSNNFGAFAKKMRFKESSEKYDTINKFNFYGAYQFGTAALKDLNLKKDKLFLKNKILQDAAFIAYCSRSKYLLKKIIKKYNNKKINNILITESGIIAAAHLMGTGNIRKYLSRKGKYNKKDKLGTSIEDYLIEFKNYNLNNLKGYKKTKINLK